MVVFVFNIYIKNKFTQKIVKTFLLKLVKTSNKARYLMEMLIELYTYNLVKILKISNYVMNCLNLKFIKIVFDPKVFVIVKL